MSSLREGPLYAIQAADSQCRPSGYQGELLKAQSGSSRAVCVEVGWEQGARRAESSGEVGGSDRLNRR